MRKKPISKSSKTQKNNEGDNPPGLLPGWPGYRTRPSRSGLDPIDTRMESAHITGTFLNRLFSLRLNVSSPPYLFLLGFAGIVLITPALLGVSETVNGNPLPGSAWLFFAMCGIPGLFLLINFIKNLIRFFIRQ